MADECPQFDYLLVIPRIRVQNANALSGPLTHGFPAMTAFLGLMWALERKVREAGLDLKFKATAVVAHDHEEQITTSGYVSTLRLTRNPLNRDGSTAAIVEEGRIHLDISLVFAVQSTALRSDDSMDNTAAYALASQVRDILAQMRIAGGTVIPSSAPLRKQRPFMVSMVDDDSRQELFNQIKLRLLPGFVLVDRTDLLEQRHQTQQALAPQTSKLEAWLSLSRINWTSETDDSGKTRWLNDREGLGWIVPIPVGYGALSELQAPGSVAHSRDGHTPFRFVESLYSVGEWLSPHRLHSVEQLLWYADAKSVEGSYRCRNDYRATSPLIYDFN
jgi:CRISPR-associated protein Csy2